MEFGWAGLAAFKICFLGWEDLFWVYPLFLFYRGKVKKEQTRRPNDDINCRIGKIYNARFNIFASNHPSCGGMEMSLEVIKEIGEAEEKARIAKTEAAASSKKLIAEAEESGRLSVDDAIRKAEDEIRGLKRQADEKASADAKELARQTENRKASMLAKADSRMAEAVLLVTERIVNG